MTLNTPNHSLTKIPHHGDEIPTLGVGIFTPGVEIPHPRGGDFCTPGLEISPPRDGIFTPWGWFFSSLGSELSLRGTASPAGNGLACGLTEKAVEHFLEMGGGQPPPPSLEFR